MSRAITGSEEKKGGENLRVATKQTNQGGRGGERNGRLGSVGSLR